MAETTTANTANAPTSTTPNPPTVASPQAFNVPQFFNAIEGMIDGACKPNCLNPYFQSTYHWRLFMAPDTDILTQTGNPNTMQAVHSGLTNVNQVTIAESGVTAYNIKDVQFTTVCAGQETTQAEGTQTWVVTITEPNGISFLDSMIAASKNLGIANYTKAPFYMMCTFLGYDESGHFIGNPAQDFSTTGRWLWALTCTNIEVKLNEAGAVYTCRFIPSNEAHIIDQYDVTRTPQSFFAVGDTVDELFKDYITKMNAAWKAKYQGEIIIFDGIDTHLIGDYFTEPASAAGKDPKTFAMKPEKPHENPNRSWVFDSKNGKYSVNVTPGYTVSNFIVDAIKHTTEGQILAKNDPIATTTDQSGSSTNSSNIRESITFVVETVLTTKYFDTTYGHYQRHIKFVVSPNYTQEAILSAVQIKVAKDATVQADMVRKYINNGLLKKRYDYIFTGENTEVIDFDLNFNMSWNALLANYGGALMRNDTVKEAALRSTITTNPSYNRNEDPTKVNLQPTTSGGGSISGGSLAATPIPSLVRVAPGAAIPQVTPSVTSMDLLPSLNTGTDFAVPVSMWQGLNQADNLAGTSNFVGQANRDQPIVGSVFAQIYSRSSVTNTFQQVKLSIRGDPYWLGQSNVHRQVQLLNNNLRVANNDLIDFKAATPVIYLYFRYPQLVDDETFKPNLQSSAVFNGLYSVYKIDHHFTDGQYKQVLYCTKINLIDTTLWTATAGQNSSASPSASNNTGGAGSSPTQIGSNGPVPVASGTAIGASPQNGVNGYVAGNKDSFIQAFTPLAQAQSARTGVAPEVILAQAGLETGWGKSAPQNNYFGIKGAGGSFTTTEVIGGQTTVVSQNFQGYSTAADSFQGYGNLLSTSRYAAAGKAQGFQAQAQAIKDAGYATDPNYASKVSNIASGIKLPVTTASIP